MNAATKNVLIYLAGILTAVLIGWAYVAWTDAEVTMPTGDSTAEEENTGTEEEQASASNGSQASSGSGATSGGGAATSRVWVKDHYEWVVNLNNGIFSPPVITIKKGDTVQFVNKDNLAMRISATLEASSMSPIIDAKTVAKGGTYSLMFTRAGKWVITNLSNSSAGQGVVHVTE